MACGDASTRTERWSTNRGLAKNALVPAFGQFGDKLYATLTEALAFSASTGEKLAEYKLNAAPVWDSIAVAQGRLYIATQDGNLHCFAERR